VRTVLPGFSANSLPPNDDGSTGAVNVGFSLNFFGAQTNQVFVNNNGNVTFNLPLAQFTPSALNTDNGGIPIIAPFFADVDTTNPASNVVTYGNASVGGHNAFGVDYINVGYFLSHADKLNSFQLILVDRSDTGAGNFDIEFNYDQIQWETGDASGGTNGLGGSSARVGYSNGTGLPGTFFELPGSGVNGAFLDGGPMQLRSVSNGGTAGRLDFMVRGGRVVGTQAGSTVGAFDPATATWYLRNSNSAGAPDFAPFQYGAPGWIPVTGDWNGDGITTIGVVDPSTMTWYLRNSNSAGAPDFTPFQYGAPGWIPVVGDWDGNGTTTIGVFDPATATWYVRNSNSSGAPDVTPFQYGGQGWTPVTGDWAHAGRTSIGVVDPSTMTWYLRNSVSAGVPNFAPFQYGAVGWTPVTGDWNGDGATTIGAFDSTTATWYLRDSNSAGAPDAVFAYGLGSPGATSLSPTPTFFPAAWLPVVGSWGSPTGRKDLSARMLPDLPIHLGLDTLFATRKLPGEPLT
jgi:hypothetical protein